MNRDAQFVMNHIQLAWSDVCAGMQKMYQSSSVRPSGVYDVFAVDSISASGQLKLSVNPVVFNVPERADRRDANLYIVVSGWLSFDSADVRTLPLKTRGFSTKIGYFRSKSGTLEHVYGAHYDIDESESGHPVFHAQISPQMEFSASIFDAFHLRADSYDYVKPILSNVRTPTAQMDIFSVFIQICADHLIFSNSNQETRDAFTALRNSCSFFSGAGQRLTYLNSKPASNCYRSTHWYAGP
jgi:hypothetical protein